MNKKIEKELLSVNLIIENSITVPEVQACVAVYGYTPEKLGVAKDLYSETAASYEKQIKELGDVTGAHKLLEKELILAKALYRKYYLIAQIAFKDNHRAIQALVLSGRRKRSLSGWIAQARVFYTNLLAESSWIKAIGEFGITKAMLNKGDKELIDVEQAWFAYNKEKGESQEATRIRDQKMDQLLDWYYDYRSIAKIALEDKPQYLEMLGILERS